MPSVVLRALCLTLLTAASISWSWSQISLPIHDFSSAGSDLTGFEDVAHDGAFTTRIPINLPPGKNGLQPELSLEYNSAAGTGVAGEGWMLAGIPCIARLNAGKGINYYRDVEHSEFYYSDDDFAYMPQGWNHGFPGVQQRLIAINPGNYRKYRDDMSRIISHGEAAEGPAYWTLEKGTFKYFFGGDGGSNAGLDPENHPFPGTQWDGRRGIRVWLLTKVLDKLTGNTIVLNYQDGHRIQNIAYTLNPNDPNCNDANLTSARWVKFEYKPREDRVPVPQGYSDVLTDIIVESGRELIADYHLDHEPSQLSGKLLLKRVTYSAHKDGTTLSRPTTYEYLEDPGAPYQTWNGENHQSLQARFPTFPLSTNGDPDPSWVTHYGDVNGDGKADQVRVNLFTLAVTEIYGSEAGLDDTTFTFSSLSNPKMGFPPESVDFGNKVTKGSQLADVNGDGFDDLVCFGSVKYVNSVANPYCTLRVLVRLGSSKGLLSDEIYSESEQYTYEFFGSGSGYEPLFKCVQLMDVNGDQRTDLVTLPMRNRVVVTKNPIGLHASPYEISVFYGQADGSFKQRNQAAHNFVFAPSDPRLFNLNHDPTDPEFYNYAPPFFAYGDFNGDGRSDIGAIYHPSAYNTQSNDVFVTFYLGQAGETGFSYMPSGPVTVGPQLTSAGTFRWHFAEDINGDAATDLIFTEITDQTTNARDVFAYLSEPHRMGSYAWVELIPQTPIQENGPFAVWSQTPLQVANWKSMFGDVNGDGRMDLVQYYGGADGEFMMQNLANDGGFDTTQQIINDASNRLPDGDFPIIKTKVAIGDLNHDDHDDVVISYFDGGKEWHALAYFGSPTGLNRSDVLVDHDTNITYSMGANIFDYVRMDLIDSNGDGKLEPVLVNDRSDSNQRVVQMCSTMTEPDLMTSMNLDFGGEKSIEYEAIAEHPSAIQVRDCGSDPNCNPSSISNTVPVSLVSHVETWNGHGDPEFSRRYDQQYDYQDNRFLLGDILVRQSLGFAQTSSLDEQRQTETTLSFYQQHPIARLIQKQSMEWVQSPTQRVLQSEIERVYQPISTFPGCEPVVLLEKSTHHFEGGGQFSTIVESYQYDRGGSTGNPNEPKSYLQPIIKTTDNAGEIYETYTQFTNQPGLWMIGRMDETFTLNTNYTNFYGDPLVIQYLRNTYDPLSYGSFRAKKVERLLFENAEDAYCRRVDPTSGETLCADEIADPQIAARWVTERQDLTYDDFGNLTVEGNALGNYTATRYEPQWFTFQEERFLSLSANRFYYVTDARGLVEEIWEPNVDPTTGLRLKEKYTFDPFGRPLTKQTPASGANAKTSWTYSNEGNAEQQHVVSSSAFSANHSVTVDHYFDGLNTRYLATHEFHHGTMESVQSEQFINGYQRTVQVSELAPVGTPSSQRTFHRQLFDDKQRRLSVDRVDASGQLQNAYLNRSYEMVAGRLRVRDSDAKGQQTTRYFDAKGRLKEVVDHQGTTMTLSYNGFDHLVRTAIFDPISQTQKTWEKGFDSWGRTKWVDDPDMGITQYTYDDLGNLLTQTDAMGRTLSFTYDALNRLTLETNYNGRDEYVSYQYDDPSLDYGIGRLARVSKYRGQHTSSPASLVYEESYVYDAAGHRVQKTQEIPAIAHTQTQQFQYEYDWDGRLTSVTYPNGDIASYEFYTDGLLHRVLHNQQTQVEVTEYNAQGQIKTKFYPSLDLTESFAYNVDHYVDFHEVRDSNQNVLLYYEYEYDDVGNVEQIWDLRPGKNLVDETQSFTYDLLDRIDSADGADYGFKDYLFDAFGDVLIKGNQVFHYSQLPGNRTAVTVRDTGGTDLYEAIHNQVGDRVQFTDRAAGDLIDYSYNTYHQLIEVNVNGQLRARFAYDHKGNRIKKEAVKSDGTIIESFYYDNGWERRKYLSNYADSLHLDDLVTFTDLGMIDQPTQADVEAQAGNAWFGTTADGLAEGSWYHFVNHLGSQSMSINANAVASRISYAPFGANVESQSEGSPTDARQFTSQVRDDEIGLYYYRSRYYDPITARFLTADSIIPDATDIQSYNRFAYVRNNPLRFVDPSGHVPDDIMGDWMDDPHLMTEDRFLDLHVPLIPDDLFIAEDMIRHYAAHEDVSHEPGQVVDKIGNAFHNRMTLMSINTAIKHAQNKLPGGSPMDQIMYAKDWITDLRNDDTLPQNSSSILLRDAQRYLWGVQMTEELGFLVSGDELQNDWDYNLYKAQKQIEGEDVNLTKRPSSAVGGTHWFHLGFSHYKTLYEPGELESSMFVTEPFREDWSDTLHHILQWEIESGQEAPNWFKFRFNFVSEDH